MRAAGALVSARFGMILATLAPTVLALIAATWSLGVALAVPEALRQAFVSSPVSVFLAPATSRGDVEALGPKLLALPDVADATLRPKDEALAALVAAGLPAPSDGRNPLPDVWTVTLRGDGPLFMTEAVAARDAISALPAVDRVRFDEAWMGSLDRVTAMWSRFGVASIASVLAGAGLALFCVHVLFGRTLVAASARDAPGAIAGIVIIGLGLAILSALIDYVACKVIVSRLVGMGLPPMKPIALLLGQSIDRTVAEVGLAGCVSVVCGVAVALSSNSSRPSIV